MSNVIASCVRKANACVGKYKGNRCDGEDDQTAVVDLLTDLRHWCDRNKVDFHGALDTSYGHYCEENAEQRKSTINR